MIKAVVFDLDDTLISEKSYILSGFDAVSKTISRDYWLDKKDVFYKMKELFSGSSKEVFNRVLDFYHVNYERDYITRLIQEYREHMPKLKVYKDVIPVLEELRRGAIRLGLITDGYKEPQRKKIESLSFIFMFDSIILTDELGKAFWKPHELPYRRSAEELNITFSEMIYVGDNVRKDFITANKLGITTIQVVRSEGIYKNLNVPKEYEASKKVYGLKKVLDYI